MFLDLIETDPEGAIANTFCCSVVFAGPAKFWGAAQAGQQLRAASGSQIRPQAVWL